MVSTIITITTRTLVSCVFETTIWTVKTRGQVLFDIVSKKRKKKTSSPSQIRKKEIRKSTLVDNSDNKAK